MSNGRRLSIDSYCFTIQSVDRKSLTQSSADPSEISFSLVNYKGASPPVDYPLNFVVFTDDLSFALPGVSYNVATNLSRTNKGYADSDSTIHPLRETSNS
jgi:hypothetical protein